MTAETRDRAQHDAAFHSNSRFQKKCPRWAWAVLIAMSACGPSHSALSSSDHPHGPEGATAALQAALPSSPVLTNLSSLPGTVEVNLTAAPAALRLIPGKTTPGY